MEVLLALLVVSILITVACAGLVTSLRAEERTAVLREARFKLRTAATRAWTGTASTAPLADPQWNVTRSPAGRKDSEPGAMLLELESRDLPGVTTRVVVHERR